MIMFFAKSNHERAKEDQERRREGQQMSRTATFEMIDGGGGGGSSAVTTINLAVFITVVGSWLHVVKQGVLNPDKLFYYNASININPRLDTEHGSSTPGSDPVVPPHGLALFARSRSCILSTPAD